MAVSRIYTGIGTVLLCIPIEMRILKQRRYNNIIIPYSNKNILLAQL